MSVQIQIEIYTKSKQRDLLNVCVFFLLLMILRTLEVRLVLKIHFQRTATTQFKNNAMTQFNML